MALRPTSSLTRRTLLQVAMAVCVLIVATSYATYRLIFTAIEERGRIHLDQYIAERAKREEGRFLQIKENLNLVGRTFLERYRQPSSSDMQARWESLAVRYPDGAWRSDPARTQPKNGSTFWAHKDVNLTPELVRRTLILHDVLEMFRPVWIESFRSLWCATPEMTNIGFDPLIPDWVYVTPADWAQNEAPYIANASPERNPERKIVWTRAISPTLIDEYFVIACLPVYDGDRLLATLGHDIRALRLVEESIKTDIAGMTHMMFMADGTIVAHPAKTREILASQGLYSMKQDSGLRPLYEAIATAPRHVSSGYDQQSGLYYAFIRLEGPDWYFAATLPRSLLEQQALGYAKWVLAVGVALLALILACLAMILRRTITAPLRRLIFATERLGAGDPDYRMTFQSADEIGHLSTSFNRMAENVAERDFELRQLNQTLEQLICERTAELKASELQTRAVLENAPEAIVVIDADSGKFVDGNENALKFLSLARDELTKRSPLEARARIQPNGETAESVVYARMDAALAGEMQVFEWIYRPERGEDVQCEVRLSRLPSATNRLVIGTITDISERKKAEQSLLDALTRERELGEMKSGFVSMVSHEFRTPLGVILSSTEILELYFDRLAAEKRHEHLRTIVRTVRSLSRLVEDVLQVGKIEAGRLHFQPEPVDLAVLCGKVVDETKSAHATRHRITTDFASDLVDASGDENLLRHILVNLLSNAVKYSADESLIAFSVRREGNDVLFTIKDSGIGIPADDLRLLFIAFKRGKNVGQRPGTGLGLVIVKRFVRLHGGDMEVISEVNVGTTVIVRLPMFAVVASPSLAHSSPSPSSAPM